MKCKKCEEEGVLNQANGNEFWYCRNCKSEIFDEDDSPTPFENDFDPISGEKITYNDDIRQFLGLAKQVGLAVEKKDSCFACVEMQDTAPWKVWMSNGGAITFNGRGFYHISGEIIRPDGRKEKVVYKAKVK